MEKLFRYNWIVRDEWFDLCSELPHEELVRERIGGTGSILKTLFHIADVEWSWIRVLQGEPVFDPDFNDYMELARVKKFSDACRLEVERFVVKWTDDLEKKILITPWDKSESFTYGEVMRHVIAHEIHHIGQLSIWSRELGRKPVSANFIGKGLV
ncbi:DinB family protein [Paenibacillus sediminis]|uniref:Damage-inducible protein DinB n=1 Tax=Paenibacillus sediminis TaxID=664909 RepID=A0ABS4H122_9BACL|nr:DinB family protein [Paenibacillus sediminis]MBP1936223.1 putative damage-inducible protein DinB [Paenibacillus sediminis]